MRWRVSCGKKRRTGSRGKVKEGRKETRSVMMGRKKEAKGREKQEWMGVTRGK